MGSVGICDGVCGVPMSTVEFQEVHLGDYYPIFMRKIDDRMLFIHISKPHISVCELNGGIRELSRINFVRMKHIMFLLLIPIIMILLETMAPPDYESIIPKWHINSLFFSVSTLLFMVSLAALFSITFTSIPSCAFICEGFVGLLYGDGVLQLFDLDGELVLERRIDALDRRVMSVVASLVMLFSIYPMFIVIVMFMETVFLYIIMSLPSAVLWFLTMSAIVFRPYIGDFRPYLYNGYVAVLDVRPINRIKIAIINIREYFSEVFEVKIPISILLQLQLSPRGIIFDKSFLTIITWDTRNIYLIDRTSLPPQTKKLMRFKEDIILVDWISEGRELLAMTKKGKAYLLDLYGNATLLRDLRTEIRFATKMDDKVYFVRA